MPKRSAQVEIRPTGKPFFFEKKNQKTFICWGSADLESQE
jgi:hypothetical protein